MPDFAQLTDPLAQSQSPFSPASPSVGRQKKESLLDNAIEQVAAPASGKALTQNEREKLKELQEQRDALKRLRAKLEESSKPLSQEEIVRELNEVAKAKSDKDRARLFGDESKTLNADDIALSKDNAEFLSAEEKAAFTSRAVQSRARQALEENIGTTTKFELAPPAALSAKAEKQAILTSSRQTYLEKKFEELRADPAQDGKIGHNDKIDQNIREQENLQLVKTDRLSVATDPDLATNPRVSTTHDLRRDDLTDYTRHPLTRGEDLRRADILSQTARIEQRDVGRIKIKDNIGARAEEFVVDTDKSIFSEYQQRQEERQSKVVRDGGDERIERVNPESHAEALDAVASKASDNSPLRKQNQLEQIEQTNPERDFGYPADVRPEKIFEQQRREQLSGGDALNAPARLVTKPAEKVDQLQRDQEPQNVEKTIENQPLSLQFQRLETDDKVNPSNIRETVFAPVDAKKETKVLAQRRDEIGIKAQGRQFIVNEERLNQLASEKKLEQAELDERFHFIEQQRQTGEKTEVNREGREDNREIGFDLRDARAEVILKGETRREDIRAEKTPAEQQAVQDRLSSNEGLHESRLLDFLQLQAQKLTIDARAIGKREDSVDIDLQQVENLAKFVEDVNNDERIASQAVENSEAFIINVVESSFEREDTLSEQKNTENENIDRFEFEIAAQADADAVNQIVSIVEAEVSAARTNDDDATIESVRNEEVARETPDGSSDLGETFAQQDLRKVTES